VLIARLKSEHLTVTSRRWANAMALLSCWLVVGMSLDQSARAQTADIVIRIQVPNRSEQTMDEAAREAFEQALLKRSGDRALLAHSEVRRTLADARSNLSLYQFERTVSGTRFVAHIDPIMIDDLIKAANGTIWAETRPPILLWLVVDDRMGRRFGNTPAEEILWVDLSDSFDALGVKLRRPLYDLPDSVLVSPKTLWDRDFGPIVEASERYGMTHLLLGRLIGLSNGRYIGEWIYRDSSVERSVSVQADSRGALIQPGLALAMDAMRQQYAVALTTQGTQKTLQVRIRNVISLEDFVAVTQSIAAIQTLEHARPIAVQGDTLTMELTGIGDADTLTRLMAPLPNFSWVSSDPDSDDGLILNWLDS